MKRILTLLVVLFTTITANAQAEATTNSPLQERAHAAALRMQKVVGLTAEQTVQIEAIQLSKFTAIEAVNADAAKTKEQKEAEIVQISTEKQKEIEAVLTPEQLVKYKQARDDKKRRKAATGPGATE